MNLRKFRDQLFEKEKGHPLCPSRGGLLRRITSLHKREGSLIRESEKAGYTVYGDWDGKMRDDNKFLRNESNFALINKDGSITYLTHGLIEEREISYIKEGKIPYGKKRCCSERNIYSNSE